MRKSARWCYAKRDSAINFSLHLQHRAVQKELHSHTEKVFKESYFARRLHAMEQQNGASAPQQVVNISQIPMEDNKTLKDAYSTTAATALGAFQIIIGVVFFYGEIDIILICLIC